MSSSDSSTPASSSTPFTAPSTPPQVESATLCLVGRKESPRDQHGRWRPSYHLQPKSGWLNDPCAPGYDPRSGLYHVSFQWNPSAPDWGDIAWGSATSPDMISWIVQDDPILSPETPYDREGVFTGCFLAEQDGSLTYAYTSVNALPIHHTLPHPKGCESLSLARSFDQGRTWQKVDANPVLPSEPENLEVTGWRDPFVARWPRMRETLGLQEGNLFGIISGGIREVTPTTFLYAIDSADTSQWRYLGPLVNLGLNKRLSRWSGDLGMNWEVTNFMTLQDELDRAISLDFLVMGTEGCIADDKECSPTLPRPCRGQLWMSGSLIKREDACDASAEMTYNFGGYLDHGSLYAANSFFDQRTQKQIAWGWIPEDDLCDDLRHSQGWSGMLSMPRELRMQTLHHVIAASSSRLEDITSLDLQSDGHGSYTVRTLASEPLQSLVHALREGTDVRHSLTGRSRLSALSDACSFTATPLSSSKWEMISSFAVSSSCRRVGLRIGHSTNYAHSTVFTFDPSSETFTIERPRIQGLSISDSAELISSRTEVAPHTLFTTRNPLNGDEETEDLQIRAWRDNSALEVFVNRRTAISTRLYAAEETFGLQFFADDAAPTVAASDERRTELLSAEVWDNIG